MWRPTHKSPFELSSRRAFQRRIGHIVVPANAKLTFRSNKVLAFWRKNERRFGQARMRVGAAVLAVFIVFVGSLPAIEQIGLASRYRLDATRLQIVGKTDSSLSKQLTYDASTRAYIFNKDIVTAATEDGAGIASVLQKAAVGASNKSNAKTYALTVPEDFSEGVTYYDANSKLSFKLVPKFSAMQARTEKGHIVFPLSGERQAVYTLKNNGLKEDIVLPTAVNDAEIFSYEFELPKSLQARAVPDGNGAIGIYSADPALFGDVSYGTEADRTKIEKARENAEKTNLVFALPAPVVNGVNGKAVGNASARFELDGNTLRVVAENLKSAGNQPLSIDPSVVVTSTSDFEYGGNNEGDIDFSIAGQVTRGALTGGDIGTWNATSSLSYTVEHSAHVFYNGYLYVMGGSQRSPALAYSTVSYANVNSDGTLGTWNTTTSLPALIAQGKAVAYNGYMYYLGGLKSSIATNEVDYAKINSDGTLGGWSLTTSLPAVNTSFGLTTSNGYIYVLGGNTNTSTLYSDVYYARLLPSGEIGSWTSTTSLTYQRNLPVAATYNGYIYVFGGSNSTPSFVTDVQYAKINDDGTIGSWIATNNFSGARYGQITTFYNGYVYLYGGWTGSFPTTLQYAQVNANGSLSTWTTSASNFTNGRTYVAGGAYKGYLYIGTGYSGSNSIDYGDFQYVKIDPQGKNVAFTNNSNPIGTARRYVQTVAIYGWLYILGGDTGAAASTAVGRMPINADGTLGTYTTTGITQLSSAGGARMLFGAFAYDGYMYVIGGCKTTLASCDTAGNTLNTTYRGNINPSTGALDSWTVQTTLNTSRYGFATVVFNNYVYVMGGTADGGGSPLNTIEYAYADFTTGTLGTWTTVSSGYNLPAGLTNFSAVANGGTVYIVGGCTTGTAATCTAQTNAVYHAKLSASGGFAAGWSSGGTDAAFSTARYGTGLTVLNGMLYLVGGYDGTNYYADLQYAPIDASGVVGTWQTGNPIATTAVGAAMSSQNGVLYVVGGYNGSYQTTVRRAVVNNGGRGQTGTWVTNATDLTGLYPSGVGYSRSIASDGYIYLIGGNTGSVLSTVSFAALGVDGSVGSWSTTNSLQTGRYQHAAFAYNGYMYVVGGQTTGGVKLTSVEYAKINSNGTVGAWAYTSSLSSTWGGLSGIDGAIYKGYMYITGGTDGTSVKTEAQYAQINANGTLGSWTDATTFTTARQLHSSIAVNGYLYIIGGYAGAGNYFSDIQMAPINSNGSIGSWSYTAPLPVAGKGMIVVPYNGYVYAYTGNTNTGLVGMNTYVWYAPLNADGSMGDWQMVVGSTFTTSRASSSGTIYNGYMYILGGNTSPFYSDIQYAPVSVMARKGRYTRMVPVNAKTINSITYNGILPGMGSIAYIAYSANGTSVASGRSSDGNSIIGSACSTTVSSAAYLFLTVTLDDTTNGGGVYADASSTSIANVTDITITYEPAHPLPMVRLRHGQTLQSGALSALDTCIAP